MHYRAIAPARKDINEDFPLRGFVTCASCDTPMTACWSKSATGKRHPYYWCQTRDCSMHRKSIRRDEIEEPVEQVIQALQPSQNLFEAATAMLKHAWDMRLDQQAIQSKHIGKQIKEIDTQIGKLLDRIVASDSSTVIAAFEKRIETLETEKKILAEKQAVSTQPAHSFEEIFERAMTFLASPWNIYKNGSLTMKKLALRLAFRSPMAYDRESGFRTPQAADIFGIFGLESQKCEMVQFESDFSNSMFEVLHEWNVQLKPFEHDLGGPEL